MYPHKCQSHTGVSNLIVWLSSFLVLSLESVSDEWHQLGHLKIWSTTSQNQREISNSQFTIFATSICDPDEKACFWKSPVRHWVAVFYWLCAETHTANKISALWEHKGQWPLAVTTYLRLVTMPPPSCLFHCPSPLLPKHRGASILTAWNHRQHNLRIFALQIV